MKSFRSVVVIAAMGWLLAGCSFEDIFSKLATSNLEQGAKEEYQQGKIIEAKQKVIEEKKTRFTEWTELKNVSDTTKYVAVAYRKSSGDSMQIDVEAMLPNPDRQVYTVWLRGISPKDRLNIGVLRYNQTDDYSFSYTGNKSISAYPTIMISREAGLDDQPETIIMTGAFATASAVPESVTK